MRMSASGNEVKVKRKVKLSHCHHKKESVVF